MEILSSHIYLQVKTYKRYFVFMASTMILSGCWLVQVDKPKASVSFDTTTQVIGQSLGNQAGGVNETELANVYALTTTHKPAAVRPDPDVYVRNLLLQYREKGSTLAREIGRVEQYRLLMGGAPEDFAKNPALEYDATSFLAMTKVNEELCEALVAPNAEEHPGWATILPNAATDVEENLLFLAQRFLGKPSSSIDSSLVTTLRSLMDNALSGSSYTYESYLPACLALSMDAEALLL